jgi:dihydrofolate synthase/folylpolyglutamate synthase
VSLLKKLPQFSISDEAIVRGLQQVVSNTGLRGRWEVLGQQPKIVADVAHNPAGLKAVFAQLNQEQFDNLHVIFGVVSDKNIHEILMLLPKKATYYVCAANVPRAMHTAALAMELKKKCMDYSTHSSVADALNAAKIAATKNDFILVGGSVFVVAEILP